MTQFKILDGGLVQRKDIFMFEVKVDNNLESLNGFKNTKSHIMFAYADLDGSIL